MESFQPSPPFQRNDELSCSWKLDPAQGPCHSLGAGRGHLQHQVPVTALGVCRVGSPGNPQSPGITLMLGWAPFSCFSLQSTSSSLPAFQPDWSLTAFPGCLFSRLVWNLGKSGIVLSKFQFSLILWRSCSEFLSCSGWGNSAWLYPLNKAALMLHTCSTHDDGFCPLCKDKLFLPLDLSSLSLS